MADESPPQSNEPMDSHELFLLLWTHHEPELRAFTMASDEISGTTEKIDDLVTSGARKTIFIPPCSTDWHTGTVKMDPPPNAKTLVFAVAAKDLPKASEGTSRYIDDIKATIVVSEADGES